MANCVILDLEGYELTTEEAELLVHPNVAGVILFTRNYFDRQQLRALTHAIRKKHPRAIIAIDQEGGRVQRFRQDFTPLPPMSFWGEQYQQDADDAKRLLSLKMHQLCTELYGVGINVNLIPVLDINYGISHVIGERSLHHDPAVVIELAREIIHSLHNFGMPAAGKHFPGHGGVQADSHLDLPVDKRPYCSIDHADLLPFKQLARQLDIIIPAHIIYSECDEWPATFSHYWLQQVLREQLQFNGLILSDDLTMQGAAIMGDYPSRAYKALMAGVDLLLVCNHRAGAIAILEYTEQYCLPTAQITRLQQFQKRYNLSA